MTADYLEVVQTATNETDEEGGTIYETQVNEKQFVLEIGGYADSGCYARIAGSGMVYLIDLAVSDAMLYTTAADLLPDEVLLMDWETVTAVEIALDGKTYSVEQTVRETADEKGTVTEETVWTLDGEELAVTGVLDTLTAMTSTGYAAGVTPERSAEIRFLIHRDMEPSPRWSWFSANMTAATAW